ncbi:lysophospholipid acyltransferase family protein [Sediminispirochaeta smaragdinae]|uniref:Phospholipid/glycerol acyltransferase n=1 Tax=Sediminispirochaeta smaragdinae (strain DSM 11293 / JCM 15392 / SEBR 4228) TaxID=573413 RepID=E1R836_SEDSS|nr:lysophospholipid acyltransferase family protein [Sediminispirochaeta smaragdinae]ADK82891.1 phospholipid/glycerol acyltransferase [Sediminispirochaeta smaragdinae DSM 11293]
MIRTVIYLLSLTLILILSAIFVVFPALLLRLFGMHRASTAWLSSIGSFIHRLVIFATGARVTVKGMENFPALRQRGSLCLVANHQSYFDIPLVVGFLPGITGFIAKKEVFSVPFINLWMLALGCIKLDRSSPRSSVRAIEKGIDSIKKGKAVMIFPEGTRSKSEKVGPFKAGSLKLATRSGAIIVPLTIEGTADMFEAKGWITPSRVTITINPSIDTKSLSQEERRGLAERLRRTIIDEGTTLV